MCRIMFGRPIPTAVVVAQGQDYAEKQKYQTQNDSVTIGFMELLFLS
jgi:hypothetical protein